MAWCVVDLVFLSRPELFVGIMSYDLALAPTLTDWEHVHHVYTY